MTAASGPDVRDIPDELTPGFEAGALSAPEPVSLVGHNPKGTSS